MKLLIVGSDAVCPEYIFEHPENYPFLTKMVNNGASAEYSAYVQKGYHDSYLSEMNWSSIHTGLAPWVHKIAQKFPDGKRVHPRMKEYTGMRPFWEEINKKGYKVGLWAVDCCDEPVEIDGYVISVRYEILSTPRENRLSKRELQICNKDEWIRYMLPGDPPPRQYPKTLSQTGMDYKTLQSDSQAAEDYTEKYHFQDAIPNLKEELEWFYTSMTTVQRTCPVDVMYFYTPSTDLIGHCAMYKDQSETLVEAYKLMDEFTERLCKALNPENVIFMSDHGMINFKDMIKCGSEEIRREAYAARDEVIWFKNGYIAFEAMNGALLYTAHGLKGTFIAAGSDVKHTKISGMRTLDIYPCILEMLKAEVPNDREGYVPDIFVHKPINSDRLLRNRPDRIKRIAIIQTCSVSRMRIVCNEVYLRERFSEITVVGDARYREIFENDPRVHAFVETESFEQVEYDEVYCGYYNEDTNKLCDVMIYRK